METMISQRSGGDLKAANMQAKIEVCEAKTRMIADTMAGMDDKIQMITEKMEKIEINNAKRMLVMSGFEADRKKYIARQQIVDFMNTEVRVDIDLEEFYYVGQGEPRDVVLIMATVNQKKNVFRNKDNIKHLRKQSR